MKIYQRRKCKVRRIRFELTGILGNQEFKKDSDIKMEAERLFKGIVNKVENVSECKVVNNEFVVDIMESQVIYNEDMIEKDLTYKFILETSVYSTLSRNDILKCIHEIAKTIEINLSLAVVDPSKEYSYKVVKDDLLFDEVEFVETICKNIGNLEIELLSMKIAGFDYAKEGLDLSETMSKAYKKLNKHDLVRYTGKIVEILENSSDMQYYELIFYYKNPTERSLKLFGEGGLTWYFKTDLDLTQSEILDECIIQSCEKTGYQDLLEAVPYLDDIREISKKEFYSSI